MIAHDLLVARNDLRQCELQSGPVPEPGAGEALLRVDAFALTANNITYGVAGDSLGYWGFFPAPPTFGRIPAWGFADVIASNAAGLAAGDRIYGYVPMSTHLVVRPEHADERGFVDGAAHRQALPPTYNSYRRCALDPLWTAADEAWLMLLRPLFTTSFLLDDYLEEHGFFGADDVLLSSASSKTAFGLAFLLHQRKRARGRVIGLTSPANRAFVEGLGCYDVVVPYDDLAALPHGPAVLIDMAGNAAVRRAVHTHHGDALKHSAGVGITHWGQPLAERAPWPGPKPVMFFAPSQLQKRVKAWGKGQVEARMAPAWRDFIAAASGSIAVQQRRGPEAARAAYEEMAAGRTPPDAGLIVSLWPA